jgi:hypothetical protein
LSKSGKNNKSYKRRKRNKLMEDRAVMVRRAAGAQGSRARSAKHERTNEKARTGDLRTHKRDSVHVVQQTASQVLHAT